MSFSELVVAVNLEIRERAVLFFQIRNLYIQIFFEIFWCSISKKLPKRIITSEVTDIEVSAYFEAFPTNSQEC